MKSLLELEVNDEVYVNKEGLEYIKQHSYYEHLAGYAFTSKVRIVSVNTWIHDDEYQRGALYEVIFVNDPECLQLEFHDRELSFTPLHYFGVQKDDGFKISQKELEEFWTDTLPDTLPPSTPMNIGQIEFEIKDDKLVLPDYAKQGKELGELVNLKQKAYGNAVEQTYEVIKVFLKPYKTEEGYVIPEALLKHLLLQVRIIDKQNRIFNNPEGDLMDESPYGDIGGYSLIGKNN